MEAHIFAKTADASEEEVLCVGVDRVFTLGNGRCGSEWTISGKMQVKGNLYGTIYQACCESDCKYILKYQKSDFQRHENEVKFQDLASRHKLALPVVDSWFCGNGGTIVMKRLQKSLKDLVLEADTQEAISYIMTAFGMLEKLHSLGIIHGDPHSENYMVRVTADYDVIMRFIDFGESKRLEDTDDVKNDLTTFLSSLNYEAEKNDRSDLSEFLNNMTSIFEPWKRSWR